MMMALAATVMFACSKQNSTGLDDPNEVKDPAYASVSIGIPATKADPNDPEPGGDGIDIGTASESSVKEVMVFLFKKSDGTFLKTELLPRSKFTPSNGNPSKLVSQAFKVAPGEYYVSVVVNPNTTVKNYTSLTKTEFEAKQHQEDATPANDYGDEKFMMTTADPMQSVEVVSGRDTEIRPANLSFNVERMAAKVMLTMNTDNTWTAFSDAPTNTAGKEVGKVVFTHYKLMNLRTSAYLLRRVGESNGDNEIGKKEPNTAPTTSDYVIDPLFDLKIKANVGTYSTSTYYRNLYSVVEFKPLNGWGASEKLVDYCLENTMLAEHQINGYSTGIQFRATYSPKVSEMTLSEDELAAQGSNVYYQFASPQTDNTFYLYNGQIFISRSTLQLEYPGASLTDCVKYDKGVCYYNYWIRHVNNNAPNEMGIMEFAIVRNNVYKLSINSVKGFGKNDPEITPEDEDEDPSTFLNVDIKILPWTLRNNVIDF